MKNRTFVCILLTVILVLVVAGLTGCTRAKPVARSPRAEVPTAAPMTAVTPLLPLTATVPLVVSPTTAVTQVTPLPLEPSPTPVPGMPTATPAPGEEQPTVEPTVAVTLIVPLTPLVEPPPTKAPSAPPAITTGKTYKVKGQDTLFSIAVRFGTTVEAIKEANNLTSDLLSIGQELIIPLEPGVTPEPGVAPPSLAPVGEEAGPTVSERGRVYVVKPGDNLFRIALKYNVSLEAIAQANNIMPPWYTIYVGQRLIIP